MNRTAVWLCSITGVLWVVVGLRDIFAPGFFTMSPRIMSKMDITFEFAVAATFLVAAGVFGLRRRQASDTRNK